MMRKPRGRVGQAGDSGPSGTTGPCAVCALDDVRALVTVSLKGGIQVTLCGTHELMFRRDGSRLKSTAELRLAFGNRRSIERRGERSPLTEADELAEALNEAFAPNRRTGDRRAS